MARDYFDLMKVYEGNDGRETKVLYDELSAYGPAGAVALNLFRASKTSTRAKLYRRSSHRSDSYERKAWSLQNLSRILDEHAAALSIVWGWAIDPDQPFHRHVLYVDLPDGQVSFHNQDRYDGPNYAKPWDGVRKMQAHRICKYVAAVMVKS